VTRRQRKKLIEVGRKERIGADEQRTRPLLDKRRERSVEVACDTSSQDDELLPNGASSRLRVYRHRLGFRAVWVEQDGNDRGRRDQLAQQLQPLCSQNGDERAHTRHVAARPVEAGDKAELDWIAASDEDDRDCRGGPFRRKRRDGTAARGNERDFAADEISRKRRQSVVLALCPTVFDCHIPALSEPGFIETLGKCGH
jgi:hypothetical protein